MSDTTDDVDGDDGTDAEENPFGTNPRTADSDSDGLLDGVELAMGLNANNPDCESETALMMVPELLVRLIR